MTPTPQALQQLRCQQIYWGPTNSLAEEVTISCIKPCRDDDELRVKLPDDWLQDELKGCSSRHTAAKSYYGYDTVGKAEEQVVSWL